MIRSNCCATFVRYINLINAVLKYPSSVTNTMSTPLAIWDDNHSTHSNSNLRYRHIMSSHNAINGMITIVVLFIPIPHHVGNMNNKLLSLSVLMIAITRGSSRIMAAIASCYTSRNRHRGPIIFVNAVLVWI